MWCLLLFASPRLAVDFVPLYFAAERVGAGLSPYGTAATEALRSFWTAPFAEAGLAYPLPLILLVVPLILFPYGLAATLWTISGGIGVVLAARLGAKQEQMWLLLLPFVFLPFHRATEYGQATLVWVGLAVVMLLAIEERQAWLVGICLALLPLKPQDGLLFAVAGGIWAVRYQRSALLWAGGILLALLSVAWLLQATWPYDWIEQVQRYRQIVQPPSLLPWGLVLFALAWRLPWWAKVALLQVVLFPLSDLYSALPLLLVWVSIGGGISLIGAGISWLWALFGLPNSVAIFWVMILVPLGGALLWHSWIAPYRKRQTPDHRVVQ
ncbi:MAG: hypothetical protein HC914_07155 [Chloroflexaceae bacterium]|nr:hypothetical protein [Chloroflexaceae bacterium]